MKEKTLSFCTIRHISDRLCEVIVDEGIEIDETMVEEYHAYFNSVFSGPFGILVNKVNNYTYTFGAQQNLATLANIHAMAVVAYRRSTEISTKALQNIKRETDWNLKIFQNRDEAIAWLASELGSVAA